MQAIANLSVNANVAKAVAEDGGINILTNLARSMNRLVAEEAAGGLWNLSVGEEHKVANFAVLSHILNFQLSLLLAITVIVFRLQGAIAEAGAVQALVDLIFKWSIGGDGVLVCIPLLMSMHAVMLVNILYVVKAAMSSINKLILSR